MEYSNTEIAYCYDNTLEGLLTAVFQAYARHENPSDIVPISTLQPRLGQTVIDIETSYDLALRVQQGICRTCGKPAFNTVRVASLSDDPHKGTLIYRFIRSVITPRKSTQCAQCRYAKTCTGTCPYAPTAALSSLTDPAVEPLLRIERAVLNERHRIMQFIRFEHVEGNVWFAQCNPKASVVPLLMDWFAARFNTQPFIIFDEIHHIAGVYEGRTWYLVKTDTLMTPKRSADEKLMQQAWKKFYRAVAIDSRYHPELRQQFMPKRFWRNITEMQEDIPAGTHENSSSTPPLSNNRTLPLSQASLNINTAHQASKDP